MAAAKRFFAQPLTETTWFNAIWFQTTWFCAVLGRESLLPLTAALIALHIALVPNRGKELRQLAAVGAVGIGVDAFLSASGVFTECGPMPRNPSTAGIALAVACHSTGRASS